MSPHDAYHAILSSGSRETYQVLVAISAVVGGWLIRRDSASWPVSPARRIAILSAAFVGSMIGCAIPAFLAGGIVGDATIFARLTTPKTVLGGILGGFVGVAALKLLIGDRADTSDAFARGGIAMMAIGRLGCIAQHCCYGRPGGGTLGWDQGDGVARVPVQVIEAACLVVLAAVIFACHHRGWLRGRLLFLLFAVYGSLRFGLEFLREPIASELFGIGFYQWIALLLAAVGAIQLRKRWPRAEPTVEPAGVPA